MIFSNLRYELKKFHLLCLFLSHTRNSPVYIPGFFWLLSLISILTGCHNCPDSKPELDLTNQPSYTEIAETQNERVSKIKSYWCRSSFEIKWYDENQDSHKEIGEGHLIMIKPDRIALTFSKLGEIYSWAGCNSELFWLFAGGDNPVVYVARNENAFTPDCAELPVSVHPLELLDLICLFEFPVTDIPDDIDIQTAPDSLLNHNYKVIPDIKRALWTVVIPGRWSKRKVYLDPVTLLPARIELKALFDDEILVAANLSQYATMDIQGISLGNLPKVPSWVEINDLRSGTNLRLALRSPSDQTAQKGSISNAMFDFNIVKRKMRPAEYIILDEHSQNPALPPAK